MDRRNFLYNLGAVAGIGTLGAHHASFYSPAREQRADVVIIGGGTGGVAAALGALRSGSRVILTEETDWIGGQLTQQAVPPDEHPWIEQFGAPASYLDFRRRVRAFYRGAYPLVSGLPDAFNPGNCGVSRICHEPRVALAVLEDMLAQYLSSGRLTVLLEHVCISATVTGDRIESVRVRDERMGDETELTAPFFIDATELGDVLPLAGVEYVTGAESADQTGEPHAPAEPQPQNMQAATWCFAMEHVDGEHHIIERPAEYAFWRDYVPNLTPAWPGLRLRGDLTGTRHGFAKRPYIREARRIRAEFTVLEQHVGLEARMAETGLPQGEVTASSFPDSVGIGSYRIDLHPSTGGDNYIDIGSLPFEIPLGALLPVRMENLLPAAKNIGTTHITNGCYRLHPVEWNIGEAAGQLAAFCIHGKHAPRQVRANPDLLEDFRQSLKRQGVEIRWPDPARRAR